MRAHEKYLCLSMRFSVIWFEFRMKNFMDKLVCLLMSSILSKKNPGKSKL